MSDDSFHYVGSELELFQHAHHWKRYFSTKLGGLVRGRVLEVGAGIGGTTSLLCHEEVSAWLCLEPDPVLQRTLQDKVNDGQLPPCCTSLCDTVQGLDASARFDTILYIDVLEHIQADREELALAATHLSEGGHLVVLAPAHQGLFSPFDASVGHFRRYDIPTLMALAPHSLEPVASYYLDACGVMVSWLNRVLLRSGMPTPGQIRFWNRVVVPLSRRLVDPLLGYRLGKTVVVAWRRESAA